MFGHAPLHTSTTGPRHGQRSASWRVRAIATRLGLTASGCAWGPPYAVSPRFEWPAGPRAGPNCSWERRYVCYVHASVTGPAVQAATSDSSPLVHCEFARTGPSLASDDRLPSRRRRWCSDGSDEPSGCRRRALIRQCEHWLSPRRGTGHPLPVLRAMPRREGGWAGCPPSRFTTPPTPRAKRAHHGRGTGRTLRWFGGRPRSRWLRRGSGGAPVILSGPRTLTPPSKALAPHRPLLLAKSASPQHRV